MDKFDRAARIALIVGIVCYFVFGGSLYILLFYLSEEVAENVQTYTNILNLVVSLLFGWLVARNVAASVYDDLIE